MSLDDYLFALTRYWTLCQIKWPGSAKLFQPQSKIQTLATVDRLVGFSYYQQHRNITTTGREESSQSSRGAIQSETSPYQVIYSRHVRKKSRLHPQRPYPRGGGKHVLFPELEAVHLLQDHPAVALALEEVGAGEDGGGTLGFASLDQHCRGHVVGLHTPRRKERRHKIKKKKNALGILVFLEQCTYISAHAVSTAGRSSS